MGYTPAEMLLSGKWIVDHVKFEEDTLENWSPFTLEFTYDAGKNGGGYQATSIPTASPAHIFSDQGSWSFRVNSNGNLDLGQIIFDDWNSCPVWIAVSKTHLRLEYNAPVVSEDSTVGVWSLLLTKD